nr:WecB/TagA/CpsF family glycosyltransferase [Ruegeria marina]
MATGAELMAEVRRRFRAGEGFALATINLDHLVKLAVDPEFASAYAAQDLVVADGRPIVALSRLAGRPVALLPGSDLVFPLAELAAEEAVPVALVGSSEAALADARRVLEGHAPGLSVVWIHAPPYGFDPRGAAAAAILSELATRGVGLCFLALGAPRQEILAQRGRELAPGVGFASVGAGLDFLGGHQVRAPRWMRRVGLEWLWRMLSNPVRLVPRYARCAAILPGQVAAARRLRRTGSQIKSRTTRPR